MRRKSTEGLYPESVDVASAKREVVVGVALPSCCEEHTRRVQLSATFGADANGDLRVEVGEASLGGLAEILRALRNPRPYHRPPE